MISVCIPVFNVDVNGLAAQLSAEIKSLNISAEAIFMDDGSSAEILTLNREINKLPDISYVETFENTGRAAIRNKLGRRAAYPWLLFLDADSLIPEKGFLKKYQESMAYGPVICGGTVYQTDPPEDQSLRLRWIYGIHREQIPAEERTRRNKMAITANNFLISRELFLQTGFRESIREYGHEDTVLGYDLFRKGIKVKHINNPVLHTGLESSLEFLSKTESALRNLLFISMKEISDPEFLQSSGLLRKLKFLDSLKLTGGFAFFFQIMKPYLHRKLTGASPGVWLFDLYRLGYLACLSRKSNLSIT